MISNLTPLGGTLPNGVFFHPTPKFLKRMSTDLWLRYRRVVDVGAGSGWMAKQLLERGLEVRAIDANHRPDPHFPVEIMLGTDFPYTDTDVAIVARPCHGTGFARDSLLMAIDCGALALYVGLAKNIEADLGDDVVWRLLDRKVGRDGESMYQVMGLRKDMRTYVQVKLDSWREFGWMKESGPRYVNEMGGGFDKDIPGVTVGKKMLAIHSDQMQTFSPEDLDPKLNSGWITSDGQFLGCHSRMHDSVCRSLLGISVRRVEELGFVRLYGPHGLGDRMLWTRPDGKRLTPKQARILDEKGYDVEDYDMDPIASKDIGT